MHENLRMSKKSSTFAAWYRTRMASASDSCGCLPIKVDGFDRF